MGPGPRDEAFALGADLVPGHAYSGGRTWRANGGVNSFDFGTVRFLRTTGLTDNGSGTHSFPKFFFNGSANTEDAVRSLNVNHDGNFQEKNPDIFVTGFTTNTNEDKDIRTIKYEDPDHE